MADEFEHDDFKQADQEAALIHVDAKQMQHSATNMMEHRAELIKQYHNGASSLAERLACQHQNNIEHLILALVDEIVKEGDHLLGNELLAGENGDLRDSTIISAKRAEVLEKAIKAAQTKMAFDKDHGIDIESPAMRVVFKYFMKKVKEVFRYLQYSDEASDTFFRTLKQSMELWQKELKQELDDMDVLSLRG